MITREIIEEVLRHPDIQILKPLVQKQIALIASQFKLSHETVEQIARLVLEAGWQWDCPNCDFRVCLGYSDLIRSGNPICPDCDEEME